jgi:hypothetical protein
MHPACGRRFRIECIRGIHPGANLPSRCTTGQKCQRQRCSSRALRADHFADGTHGQAAIEQCIDSGNAGRRRFTDGKRVARDSSIWSRRAAAEGIFRLIFAFQGSRESGRLSTVLRFSRKWSAILRAICVAATPENPRKNFLLNGSIWT